MLLVGAAGLISAARFRRATEVTGIGFAYGTKVALSWMQSRDQGTIVQVGSAPGERTTRTCT